MSITAFQALACPLDGEPLHRDGASWRCVNRHGYDIARQGYAHLLPVQRKRSLDPGDSKEMVAARRRFLNAGWYQPVAAAISRAVLDGLALDASVACLDAGCGEGYYLRQLATAAGEQSLALLGVDISKWAILAAAKQDPRPNWTVATNANLPVQTATIDRLLCVFGFPVFSEFARVLQPGGELLLVDPGPDHLRELREIIYPELKQADAPATPTPAPTGFRSLSTQTVSYALRLPDPEPIADLLAMTPHLYRASQEGRAKAATLRTLTTTVDVRLTRFERLSSPD